MKGKTLDCVLEDAHVSTSPPPTPNPRQMSALYSVVLSMNDTPYGVAERVRRIPDREKTELLHRKDQLLAEQHVAYLVRRWQKRS